MRLPSSRHAGAAPRPRLGANASSGITPLACACLALLLGAPVGAQDTSTREQAEAVLGSAIEAILGAIELPQVVEEAREAGVADSTLTVLLEDFQEGAMPAAQAEDVLAQEVEVLRAGGPVDNFGAFVQGQLEAGLRGRDLAQAIRAEHRSMGIGIPERRPERMRGARGERGPGAARGGPGAGRGGGPPEGRGPRGQGGQGADSARGADGRRRGPGGSR